MMKSRSQTTFAVLFTLLALSGVGTICAQAPARSANEVWGPRYKNDSRARAQEQQFAVQGNDTLTRLRYWNKAAINASGLDHTPVAAGETRVFGEQLGPGRSSRAMAIVHIAMFEAINAIVGGYCSYLHLPPAHPRASLDTACGH